MDNNGIVAINTLINNVVTALEYSSTETGTVTDISLAANGIYGVSINNISYQAYSSIKDLKLQDRVLIVKSNTGTSQTRIISCKVGDNEEVEEVNNVTFFSSQEKRVERPDVDIFTDFITNDSDGEILKNLVINNSNFIADFVNFKINENNDSYNNNVQRLVINKLKTLATLEVAFTKATVFYRIYDYLTVDMSDISINGLKSFLENNIPVEIESKIRNSFEIINENEWFKISSSYLTDYLDQLKLIHYENNNEVLEDYCTELIWDWNQFINTNGNINSDLNLFQNKDLNLSQNEALFNTLGDSHSEIYKEMLKIQKIIIPSICNSENLILDFTCNYFLDISKINSMKIQPDFYLCIDFGERDGDTINLIEDSHIEMPLFENTFGNIIDQTIIPNIFNKQIIIKKNWVKDYNYMTVYFKVVLTQQDQLIYLNDTYNKLMKENIDPNKKEDKLKIASYLDWPSISFWATDYIFKIGLPGNISNLSIYPIENNGSTDYDIASFLKKSYIYFDEKRKDVYSFYCDFFEKKEENNLLEYQMFEDKYKAYFYLSLDDGEFKKVSDYNGNIFESDFFYFVPFTYPEHSNSGYEKKEMEKNKLILFYPYGCKKYNSINEINSKYADLEDAIHDDDWTLSFRIGDYDAIKVLPKNIKENAVNDELKRCEKYSFYLEVKDEDEETVYKSNIVTIMSKDEYNNMIAKQQGYSIEPSQKDFNIYTGYNSIDPVVYGNNGYQGAVSLCYCGQMIDKNNIKEIKWYIKEDKSQLWLFDKESTTPDKAEKEISKKLPYVGFQMFDRFVFNRTPIYCDVTLVNKQKLQMRTFIYSDYIKKDNKDRIIIRSYLERGKYPIFRVPLNINDSNNGTVSEVQIQTQISDKLSNLNKMSLNLQLFDTKTQNIFKLTDSNNYYHTQHLKRKEETDQIKIYYRKNDNGEFDQNTSDVSLNNLYQQGTANGYISGEPLCIYESGSAESFSPVIKDNLSNFIKIEENNNLLAFKTNNITKNNNTFDKKIVLKLDTENKNINNEGCWINSYFIEQYYRKVNTYDQNITNYYYKKEVVDNNNNTIAIGYKKIEIENTNDFQSAIAQHNDLFVRKNNSVAKNHHLILKYNIDLGWQYGKEIFYVPSSDMAPDIKLADIENIDIEKEYYKKVIDNNVEKYEFIPIKEENPENEVNNSDIILRSVTSAGFDRIMLIAQNKNYHLLYWENENENIKYLIKYGNFYQKLQHNDILEKDGSKTYYQPISIEGEYSNTDKEFFPYSPVPIENLRDEHPEDYYEIRFYETEKKYRIKDNNNYIPTTITNEYAYCKKENSDTYVITTDKNYNDQKIYYAFQKTDNTGTYVLNGNIFEKYDEHISEHTGLTHYSKMNYSNSNKNYFDKQYIYAEPKETYIRIRPDTSGDYLLPEEENRPSVIDENDADTDSEKYYVMIGDKYFKAQGQKSSDNITYFTMNNLSTINNSNIGFLYEEKQYGQPPEAFGLSENLYFFIISNYRTGFMANPEKLQFSSTIDYASDVTISKTIAKYGGLYKYFAENVYFNATAAPEYKRECLGLGTNLDINNYSASLTAVDLLQTQSANPNYLSSNSYTDNNYQNSLSGNGILTALAQSFASSSTGFYDSASGFIESATQSVEEIAHEVECAGYIPRLSNPQSNLSGGKPIDKSPFWTQCAMAPWFLPNCTCYAYGRYAEAYVGGNLNRLSEGLQHAAGLSTRNATYWFSGSSSKTRASVEQFNADPNKMKYLGAVICWEGGPSGMGHVAIVEEINNISGNVAITMSQSHYKGTLFNTGTVYKNGHYDIPSYSLKCQGFILQ